VEHNIRTQGKGDKNRDLVGWMSNEITQRLKRIFKNKGKVNGSK